MSKNETAGRTSGRSFLTVEEEHTSKSKRRSRSSSRHRKNRSKRRSSTRSNPTNNTLPSNNTLPCNNISPNTSPSKNTSPSNVTSTLCKHYLLGPIPPPFTDADRLAGSVSSMKSVTDLGMGDGLLKRSRNMRITAIILVHKRLLWLGFGNGCIASIDAMQIHHSFQNRQQSIDATLNNSVSSSSSSSSFPFSSSSFKSRSSSSSSVTDIIGAICSYDSDNAPPPSLLPIQSVDPSAPPFDYDLFEDNVEVAYCRDEDCHDRRVTCLVYNDRTDTIWSGSADGTLRVWPAQPISRGDLLESTKRRGWLAMRQHKRGSSSGSSSADGGVKKSLTRKHLGKSTKWKDRWVVLENGRLQWFEDRYVGSENGSILISSIRGVNFVLPSSSSSSSSSCSDDTNASLKSTIPRMSSTSRSWGQFSKKTYDVQKGRAQLIITYLDVLTSQKKLRNITFCARGSSDKDLSEWYRLIERLAILMEQAKNQLHTTTTTTAFDSPNNVASPLDGFIIAWTTQHQLPNTTINDLQIIDGNTWCCTSDGLVCEWLVDAAADLTGLRPDLCKLVQARRIRLTAKLPSDSINCTALREVHRSVIWVSTPDRIVALKKTFTNLTELSHVETKRYQLKVANKLLTDQASSSQQQQQQQQSSNDIVCKPSSAKVSLASVGKAVGFRELCSAESNLNFSSSFSLSTGETNEPPIQVSSMIIVQPRSAPSFRMFHRFYKFYTTLSKSQKASRRQKEVSFYGTNRDNRSSAIENFHVWIGCSNSTIQVYPRTSMLVADTPLDILKVDAPVLCLQQVDNEVVVGTKTGSMFVFHAETHQLLFHEKKAHSFGITTMTKPSGIPGMYSLWMASQDQTISYWQQISK